MHRGNSTLSLIAGFFKRASETLFTSKLELLLITMVNKDLVILVLTEAVYRLRVHLKHVPTV